MKSKINLSQCVILAGGLGERMMPLTEKIPKPLISINNTPFLFHLLKMLKDNNFKDVLILGGYKSEEIEKYITSIGNIGLNITFSNLDLFAQTSKRLNHAKDLIEKHFLLIYCDNYWPIDLKGILEKFNSENNLAQITVYDNKFGYTKNNVDYSENKIINYDSSRQSPNLKGVNIGYIVMNKSCLENIGDQNIDFESKIFPNLIKNSQLGYFKTKHKYYSIGSLNRLPITEKYFSNQKYIFLDRDGVLNEKMPKAQYVVSWDQWKWRDGALEGLKFLKEKNIKVIIITNQAGVSRLRMSKSDLDNIHKQMLEDIRNYGGDIEKIYVCTCNWNDDCDCRKPKPGMLFQAQFDFDFKMEKTFFIGDDERDKSAAIKAGCKPILIKGNDRLDLIVKQLFD
ncbi:MAG: histidinol phosphate phosphatase [Chloroflexi bacterium]|nr:histidinol phosphate phosphatase [Chloroflexota bacterium]|tara:strand:- start:4730 stop:5920 length:1191 start_codon:yes stop_codon:yes gene_type:complete